MFVSSKWGFRYTANWRSDADVHEVTNLSLERFESQWAGTRAMPRPDVYQIHSATIASGVLDDAALLGLVLKAQHAHGATLQRSVTTRPSGSASMASATMVFMNQSGTSTRFRPLCFALYRHSSAR